MPDPDSSSEHLNAASNDNGTPYNIIVSFSIEDAAWRDLELPVPLENLIETVIRSSLLSAPRQLPETIETLDVSIVLMDDAQIHAINKDYRNQDKPTNVLSFPQFDFSDSETFKTDSSYVPLGDILLARETLQREAKEQGKDLDAHIAHMAAHGTLYLL